jgi:acetoin utilization deacetylase AcuC-like enzyme
MIAMIFDKAATEFGQDYHPERPARLINTEAYVLDKHPDWVWIKRRLALEAEVLRAHHPKHLERLRKPVDLMLIPPTTLELKNTPDVLPEQRSAQSIWHSAVEKDLLWFVRRAITRLQRRRWDSAI